MEPSSVREPARPINPTEVNNLPNSAENGKSKADCEISLPKD